MCEYVYGHVGGVHRVDVYHVLVAIAGDRVLRRGARKRKERRGEEEDAQVVDDMQPTFRWLLD